MVPATESVRFQCKIAQGEHKPGQASLLAMLPGALLLYVTVNAVQAITDTPAMQAGVEQHAVLEAETAQAQVEVLTETREDAFAVRLVNMSRACGSCSRRD